MVEDDGEYEVATFRTEGPYLNGRHPSSVRFATAREDVARRDFTVNGLLYDPRSTGQLTRALRTLVDDRARIDAFARMIPPVKSMETHAREWEAIYAEVIGRRP